LWGVPRYKCLGIQVAWGVVKAGRLRGMFHGGVLGVTGIRRRGTSHRKRERNQSGPGRGR